jgi:hypothetical protein
VLGAVRDEHGIGGGGVYCSDNDAQLGRIKSWGPIILNPPAV